MIRVQLGPLVIVVERTEKRRARIRRRDQARIERAISELGPKELFRGLESLAKRGLYDTSPLNV